jgi:hypothetical protein
MSSSELLERFLYDDEQTEIINTIPLSDFPIEFQFDPSSQQQTFYNFANWYKKNDKNIGCLPEPFFSDYITLITARSFGIDLEEKIDEK